MARKNTAPESWHAFKERQYDELAAGVRGALDMGAVYRAMEEFAG